MASCYLVREVGGRKSWLLARAGDSRRRRVVGTIFLVTGEFCSCWRMLLDGGGDNNGLGGEFVVNRGKGDKIGGKNGKGQERAWSKVRIK